MLSAVARRIEREWNTHLAAWDLNHAPLPVLAFLSRGPLSQRDLARASGVTEQTMSRIVARLERSGYVERQPDADDARRHRVTLTEAGLAAFVAAGDPVFAEEMSIRGLDEAQVDQLRDLLAHMLAAHPLNTADPFPNEDPHAHLHPDDHPYGPGHHHDTHDDADPAPR
jgi:DNA-binding MarR family transcriptional regulator